ncbi:MAG: tetratricopeptide repeat protein [Candidatus Zixiibacteriota bacterium]
MQKRLFLLIVVLMGTLLFYLSCEEKGVEKITARELIERGWPKFEAGDFAGATSDFSAALSIATNASDSSEAFLGLGWTNLRQNHGGLAENNLVRFLSLTSGSNDGKAGLALAYLAQEKFQSAIDTANVVLASDSLWSFGHDNSINYLDLLLLLAQSYYELADFNTSLEIVQEYFDRNFVVDPNTPEGKTDLAEKIYSLWTG